MAVHWDDLQKRYDDLSDQLSTPDLESSKRQQMQKEHAHLGNLLEQHTIITTIEKALEDAKSERSVTTDQEMIDLYDQEITELEKNLIHAQQEFERKLYPPDPHDDRSVFLEIRAGTGGQEAALFAGDLLKMYTTYALKQGWRVEIDSSSSTDLGGYKEVVININGKNVYGHLKFESGVHRVQRVPATETSGRVHTSTATVAVLPEAESIDVTINPADLRIDVYRASGAGGQHVNTTDSAVRITHIPTGAVVACQDERSQHKNKAKAMKLLQSRILAAQVEKEHAQMSKERKQQVGTGVRSEKVRTYNYPQNRVTDHQVDVTLKNLDMVMIGQLDDIIDALRSAELKQRREAALAL